MQLGHVHRFAQAWERQASLALRAGNPDALVSYEAHGRLHGGSIHGVERQVLDHWDAVRQDGTVAIVCATNDTARRLSQRIQQSRAAAGEINVRNGRSLTNGQRLHVGDVVATRRNRRTLATDNGTMVENRARWEVEALHRDGSVTVRGNDGAVRLATDYVDSSVELAYAETVHAAQGRTEPLAPRGRSSRRRSRHLRRPHTRPPHQPRQRSHRSKRCAARGAPRPSCKRVGRSASN